MLFVNYLQNSKKSSGQVRRKVYASDDYQNNWNGDQLPDGTYFYLLKQGVTDQEFKGTVFIGR